MGFLSFDTASVAGGFWDGTEPIERESATDRPATREVVLTSFLGEFGGLVVNTFFCAERFLAWRKSLKN